MPDGVEDPVQRHSEVALATQPAALQTFEQRSELAATPMNDADRDVHLRVQHVLRVQLLHHAIGDEFVIVSSPQPLSDSLEGQQEAGEILVLVQRPGFLLGKNTSAVGDVCIAIVSGGKRSGMAAAQLRQRRRIDSALEMKVQL